MPAVNNQVMYRSSIDLDSNSTKKVICIRLFTATHLMNAWYVCLPERNELVIMYGNSIDLGDHVVNGGLVIWVNTFCK